MDTMEKLKKSGVYLPADSWRHILWAPAGVTQMMNAVSTAQVAAAYTFVPGTQTRAASGKRRQQVMLYEHYSRPSGNPGASALPRLSVLCFDLQAWDL